MQWAMVAYEATRGNNEYTMQMRYTPPHKRHARISIRSPCRGGFPVVRLIMSDIMPNDANSRPESGDPRGLSDHLIWICHRRRLVRPPFSGSQPWRHCIQLSLSLFVTQATSACGYKKAVLYDCEHLFLNSQSNSSTQTLEQNPHHKPCRTILSVSGL